MFCENSVDRINALISYKLMNLSNWDFRNELMWLKKTIGIRLKIRFRNAEENVRNLFNTKDNLILMNSKQWSFFYKNQKMIIISRWHIKQIILPNYDFITEIYLNEFRLASFLWVSSWTRYKVQTEIMTLQIIRGHRAVRNGGKFWCRQIWIRRETNDLQGNVIFGKYHSSEISRFSVITCVPGRMDGPCETSMDGPRWGLNSSNERKLADRLLIRSAYVDSFLRRSFR